ncbi:calmodulin-like protein 4 [Acridotheres tristis]
MMLLTMLTMLTMLMMLMMMDADDDADDDDADDAADAQSWLQPPAGAIPQGNSLPFADRNAELDFSTFLTIMYRQLRQEEPAREILRALALLDPQRTGEIAEPELRAKLTALGEKLAQEEVDDLLKDAKVGPKGTIRYEEFVQLLCLPSVDY